MRWVAVLAISVTPHQRKIAAIVSRLLEWYPRNARDLPWRQTTDPYGVFVSEIMLQQTQVKMVLGYWNRWMRSLPTLSALAKASPQRIHKLWEGLGYYTRVRNMQRAARMMVKEHAGKVPSKLDELLALPGIGRYTAGAICSIAFDQPAPILDANIIRVLARLYGIGSDPRQAKAKTELWRISQELVQRASSMNGRSGVCSQFNQSLMELGALLCTRKAPRCELCPLARVCFAHQEDRVADLPALAKRPKPTARWFAAFVVEDKGRFLVRQRPAKGINGSLWEFPNVEIHRKANMKKAARMVLGASARSIERFCTIRHSITRYRITLDVFKVQTNLAGKPSRSGARWLTQAQARRLPFTGAHKKILWMRGSERLPTTVH